jgi:hypothetical protein
MIWRNALTRIHPDAIDVPWAAVRSAALLSGLGFAKENTLFANATCRDELMKQAVDRFAGIWGENFDLAGLGGYPSAGVTGFRAYASHVPDGGNLFVLYGPHVGISATGTLGKAYRPGVERETSSCGAVLGLLKKLAADDRYAAIHDPLDAEQYALERDLTPYSARILAAADRTDAVTACAYEIIDQRLGEILDRSGFAGAVALLGGIAVNTPFPGPDFFVPRRFEVRRSGEESIHLLGQLQP